MASVAIDLGATSGRVVLGKYTEDGIQMSEIHRFQNNIIKVNGRSYWDLLGLWHEILTGLRKASASGETIESVGVDTWGVDFVLLGKDGHFCPSRVHTVTVIRVGFPKNSSTRYRRRRSTRRPESR